MASEPVAVTIGGVSFQCVRLVNANFADRAAVYVILCVADGGSWTVLDVGQSGQVGSRIDSHDRRACWARNCTSNNIWVCIYPMPTSQFTEQDRLNLERKLRQQYNPPCGSR